MSFKWQLHWLCLTETRFRPLVTVTFTSPLSEVETFARVYEQFVLPSGPSFGPASWLSPLHHSTVTGSLWGSRSTAPYSTLLYSQCLALIFPPTLILCLRSGTKRLTQAPASTHGAAAEECEKSPGRCFLIWGDDFSEFMCEKHQCASRAAGLL